MGGVRAGGGGGVRATLPDYDIWWMLQKHGRDPYWSSFFNQGEHNYRFGFRLLWGDESNPENSFKNPKVKYHNSNHQNYGELTEIIRRLYNHMTITRL